ncbi:MAG TPA: alpha/beta hydrolase, partial [Candidatus Thermoplasmatota archaeon]|nr:alpha/beta hydrolase [Candidatus Thermoplasmatota archaeon]
RRVADRIAMLETPTLVVWGAQDQVLGKETAFRVAGRFRRAGKPVFVEDAGHWLPEQRPERVAAEIESFSQGW